jgi:hypothetical protein
MEGIEMTTNKEKPTGIDSISSLAEFNDRYFPRAARGKVAARRSKKDFGNDIAARVLNGIQKDLAKLEDKTKK